MPSTILQQRGDYPIWTQVSTRYSDQDPMGHVNNVAITAFLESGRVALYTQFFADTPLPPQCLVLARLSIDYLHEITFPGAVDVGGRLEAVGDKSITTRYAIFQSDTCCVIGQSVNVFFDPETRQSAEPPASVRPTVECLRAVIAG